MKNDGNTSACFGPLAFPSFFVGVLVGRRCRPTCDAFSSVPLWLCGHFCQVRSNVNRLHSATLYTRRSPFESFVSLVSFVLILTNLD